MGIQAKNWSPLYGQENETVFRLFNDNVMPEDDGDNLRQSTQENVSHVFYYQKNGLPSIKATDKLLWTQGKIVIIIPRRSS